MRKRNFTIQKLELLLCIVDSEWNRRLGKESIGNFAFSFFLSEAS